LQHKEFGHGALSGRGPVVRSVRFSCEFIARQAEAWYNRDMTEEVSTPLLATKLYIPPRRPSLVPRPRLMVRLEEALRLQRRLTLVSAKAGTGKTTLVSEWLHEQKRPAKWISLDRSDNDPRRFLSYLLAALHQLGIQSEPSRLETPQLPPAEALVAELINDVVASPIPFLLVLDDYHFIQNEWIHQAVGFLAEHQPPEMHLVLITRVDPPLPLARFRGRGQLTEIRDHDLRFTAEEAARFLQVMGLDLPAEAVSTLKRRTEGWIVGLQMAAISMRGRKQEGDLAPFLEAFGGTNRYVLDYLTEEVLSQQPPAIQDFLIETSILSRMCADLCDAVRSPGDARDSQAILDQLERSNLFLTPLDDERRWYRYHHLFADLVNSTLKQRRSAEQVRELHRRASRWHQAEGSLEEAMIHAMAAHDFERAASMIDENVVSMLSHSEAPVLLGWIEKLPEPIVRGRPWLDIYRAYTLALSGRPDEAEPLLEDVEKRIEPDMPRAAEYTGTIAAIRSYTANLWGDTDRVIEMADLAEEQLPEEHLVARGMVSYALAVTYWAGDDMDSAIQASLKMFEIGRKLDRLLIAVTALCDVASAKKVQGQLRQSQEYYDRARRWLAERNGLDSRVRCVYEVGWADSLLQWNQLDAAYEHAVTGIEYCQRFGAPSEMTWGYVTLMRVLQAWGDSEGALDVLYDAEQVLQAHRVRQALRVEFETRRVALWLAVGDINAARRWAACCNGGSEREQIALARLSLAEGRASDAQHLLERQQALAEAGGRNGRLIEILGLQALALEAQDRAEEASVALFQAVSLGRPEGYVRVFLDLGWPLYELLERSAVSAPLAGDYGRDLLDAFRQERQAQQNRAVRSAAPTPTLAEALADPLTERELEVLHLLAEGLSNKEIAGRLVVAPSTVKQHLKNIYGKLDVHSRTQAVARGRELALL
jgi:LuxR family maltose regulon positive regulatory protein